jgi:hypothetical protein
VTSSQPLARPAALPAILYLTAGVILVDQLAILLASVLPLSPGAVQWRFGAVGLAASRATPFLLADLLLLAAGLLGSHRGVLRTLGFFHLFLAPLLLSLVALFVLDAMEVRQGLPLDARRQALVSSGRALVALLALTVFVVWVGLQILRRTPARSVTRSSDRLVLDSRSGDAR